MPRCSTAVASRQGVGGGEAGVPNDSASAVLQPGEVLAQAQRPQRSWERALGTGCLQRTRRQRAAVLAAAGWVSHLQPSSWGTRTVGLGASPA